MRYLAPSGVPIRLFDILAGLGSCLSESELEALKSEICSYFGVRYCFFASSGRAALSLLLQVMGKLYPEQNEVLLPAYTSFSVPSAVVHAGLRVSLYDVNCKTLSPDPSSLAAAITPRTLCIIVCHLYGYPCEMRKVLSIAKEAGIPVVDDAAQAMGASYYGLPVGTLGDAGLFSLSRGKNISAVDGGIIVTDSPELARELENVALEPVGPLEGALLAAKALALSLMLHPSVYGALARLPFLNIGASIFDPCFSSQRFTSFQARIARRMLSRLPEITAARREKAIWLMEHLSDLLQFPEVVPGADPVYLRLPVLAGKGPMAAKPELGVVGSYPQALHDIEALRPYVAHAEGCNAARELAQVVTTLPTHQFVTSKDVDAIQRYVEGTGM